MALLTYTDPDTAYPGPPLDSGPGPAFLMMQLMSFVHIENMKSLLPKVYDRKSATRPEAVRKRDDFERTTRALEALSPPIALAKKYLTCTEEYLGFEMSINEAVEVSLDTSEFSVYQKRAGEYLRCVKLIEDRQWEETRKQCTQSAADAHNHRKKKGIGSPSCGRRRQTIGEALLTGLVAVCCSSIQIPQVLLPVALSKLHFGEVSGSHFGFDIFAVICADIGLER